MRSVRPHPGSFSRSLFFEVNSQRFKCHTCWARCISTYRHEIASLWYYFLASYVVGRRRRKIFTNAYVLPPSSSVYIRTQAETMLI
ncbi:uncharacterized protein LAESUDRAFT_257429 [Laetiporus sulphureus 93-53]|uniref:Uncharacterized protein n=1 Tax=Laetiporus sulphureus 93-53 TaxID=1314785 RepID=A0A165H3D7_9APHY|nr:uncharacterized protein LAESUDRAFT_257429 [Laetiporus sulphureus 93-53]KZT11188.1 hypothetical protein LAESUDRAFT_257429 [Laetiporus sulphureus 93-53]